MKTHLVKVLIIAGLLFTGFIILNGKPSNEYPETDINHFTGVKNVQNYYVTNLSEQVQNYDIEIPDRFEKIAENEYLELYVERPTVALAIRDKGNGYVWYSYDVYSEFTGYSQEKIREIRSAVTIKTYNQYTPGSRNLLDARVKITYEIINNGFIATVDFTDIMIKFDIHAYLDGKDLVLEIPNESVQEYNPDLWKPGKTSVSLSELHFYPYFGSTSGVENGYFVIPDGVGALVKTTPEPRTKIGFNHWVHSRDIGFTLLDQMPLYNVRTVKPLARITLPIFGIVHDEGNTGVLVIAESGSNYGKYNYVPKGLDSDYYQSYFNYDYRKSFVQFQSRTTGESIMIFPKKVNNFELKHRIVFLHGEDANYVGVAKKYREFLEDRYNLTNQVAHQDEYPTRIELLGMEVTKGIFVPKYTKTTEYEEAIELLKQIQKDGYTNLETSFKTFDLDEYGYRFKIYRQLGGKKDFKKLLDYLEENNIEFSYYIDYVHKYKKTNNVAMHMNYQAVVDVNLTYMFQTTFFNSSSALAGFIKNDLKEFNKYNITGFSLDGLNHLMFTTTENREVVSSSIMMERVQKALDLIIEDGKTIALYNPDAYLLPYTHKYLDFPLTSSEVAFSDATIPLVPLVMTGHAELFSPYMNFITNEKHSLLRMIEYGINPAYIMTYDNTYDLLHTNSSDIYISQYQALKERMAQYDEILREGLNAINGVELVNHQYLANGIAMSTFRNGVTIIINYTSNDYNYNGKIIKANGYGIL